LLVTEEAAMNVEGVAGPMRSMATSGASPIAGGRFDGQLQGAMGDVASMLHTSPQQLAGMVKTGGSLAAVANSAGIPDQKLVDTIKQGLVDAGSKLTGSRLQNIASRIAHHRRLQLPGVASGAAGTGANIAPTNGSATTGV
jgi:hypothetical protein